MHIIEDTRQKVGKHSNKQEFFESEGHFVTRCKLPFGDYALPPKIAIDTKQNIDELATNITSDHARFKRECIAARDAGCKLVILVENKQGIKCIDDLHIWTNKRAYINKKEGKRPPIDGERLKKACITMSERYGVCFRFCHPSETGDKIVKILSISEG